MFISTSSHFYRGARVARATIRNSSTCIAHDVTRVPTHRGFTWARGRGVSLGKFRGVVFVRAPRFRVHHQSSRQRPSPTPRFRVRSHSSMHSPPPASPLAPPPPHLLDPLGAPLASVCDTIRQSTCPRARRENQACVPTNSCLHRFRQRRSANARVAPTVFFIWCSVAALLF